MDVISMNFIQSGEPIQAYRLSEPSRELQYKDYTIRTYMCFCEGKLFFAYRIFEDDKLMYEDPQGSYDQNQCVQSAMFEIEEQLAETVEPSYDEEGV